MTIEDDFIDEFFYRTFLYINARNEQRAFKCEENTEFKRANQMKTYDEWEKEQNISPSSPEAYYAEKAWREALKEAAKEFSEKNLEGSELLKHWSEQE